jgi:hypothetical protein
MTEGKGAVLTDKQSQELDRLQGLPKRTDKQEETLLELIAKRDAPPKLSDTCISYLKEVYVYQKYGKEPVGGSERSIYTKKGKMVEDESIMMLSRADNTKYTKNEIRFNNEYLTGEPDIIANDGQKIIDIKSSYDFATLLSNYGFPLNPSYQAQLNGYMALTGATEGEVAYCLVSMPQEIINGEKRRLFYTMNPATEEDPLYVKAVDRMENNYTFDEVPINERMLRFPVHKDEEYIQRVYKRIEECRKWLKQFDGIHSNLYITQ